MNTPTETRRFKAPRWVSTEAGQWAYEVREEWRHVANQTFDVTERRRLLDEAEKLHKHSNEPQTA
ncbi:MAG: hypothetical protein HGA45_08520 [Chloroflexales bacterium]|nr:hypothetical protein [Chloroflexales bacterium]